jgi:hypothetical protein
LRNYCIRTEIFFIKIWWWLGVAELWQDFDNYVERGTEGCKCGMNNVNSALQAYSAALNLCSNSGFTLGPGKKLCKT